MHTLHTLTGCILLLCWTECSHSSSFEEYYTYSNCKTIQLFFSSRSLWKCTSSNQAVHLQQYETSTKRYQKWVLNEVKWDEKVRKICSFCRFPGDHDTPATPKGRPSGTKIEWPPSSPNVVSRCFEDLWRSLKHSSHNHHIIDHIIDPCWSNEFTLLELGWRRLLCLLCFWYLVNLVSADRVEPRQGISTNHIESYHPEILRHSSDLERSRGDRCAAVCRAYFTRLAFAPPKESPITPDPSRIVERVLLEKLSQAYKPVSFLIRALLCLITSYPTSSTFSLFQLFILLTTSALGFVDVCFMHFLLTHRVPEPRYSQNLVSPAPFFTFDEGHAKKCCELYSVRKILSPAHDRATNTSSNCDQDYLSDKMGSWKSNWSF